MGNSRRQKKATGGGLQVATARFASVLDGSTIKSVDPRACIPLTKIRRYSRSGILRLKRIFSGSQSGSEVVGFVAGSDCPIVIPLVGSYSRVITEYVIKEEGLTEEEAKVRVQSRDVWYGVVDGMHRVLALFELINEQPEKWDGFSLPVTVLKGGHDILTLKQLARQQNKKHTEAHYVETTLYDHLRGLKDEATSLSNNGNGRRPLAREVAEAYDGPSEYKDQTMLQMANTAMRLPDRVVEVLGEIMSSEHPDLVQIPPELSHALHVGDTESIMAALDCRVYRRFINITSLKSATVFMKGGEGDAVETQVNTLYRCREICRSNNFKAVPYRTVVEQYERATQAMKECEKMETLMETDKWPAEMQTLRGNILRTLKFDAEILANAGNDAHILPALLKHYENVCSGVSTTKIQKYNALYNNVELVKKDTGEGDSTEQLASKQAVMKAGPEDADGGIDGTVNASNCENEKDGTGAPKNLDDEHTHFPEPEGNEASVRKESVEVERTETERNEEDAVLPKKSEVDNTGGSSLQTSTAASERLNTAGESFLGCMEVLKSKGITIHQMRWQDFDETVKEGSSSELFDILLTDPPYGLPENRAKSGTRYNDYVDEKEMKQLAEFARRSLVPGGYVFLFCSQNYFNSWLHAFIGTAFRCMKYPFVIHKNGDTMQAHRNEEFPQNNCEYGLIARAPNAGINSFKPDFSSPFHEIPCRQKRRFASLIECPVPRSKLTNGNTKAPLLTEEKNPKVLIELLQTFSKEGARVLDCYGGTLTTAIACLMSGRRCCVIEKDAELFKYAAQRLLRMSEKHDSVKDGKRARLNADACDEGSGNDENDKRKEGSGNDETDKSTKAGSSEVLQSTGEPENETPQSPWIEDLHGGDDVWLTVSNRRVATAKLQYSVDSERNLKFSIHRHDLSAMASDGEVLVAVWGVVVQQDEIETMYPYSFKSIDENPRVLGEMVKAGIYAWDLNCMEPKET